jgi:hypothetical protein
LRENKYFAFDWTEGKLVGLEIFVAATTKNIDAWRVASCNLIGENLRFAGLRNLRFQGRRLNRESILASLLDAKRLEGILLLLLLCDINF